jgi:hypothetical protein
MVEIGAASHSFFPPLRCAETRFGWYASGNGCIRLVANAVEVKDELVAKLQNEISVEEELKDDEDLSVNIKEYLESSPFEVFRCRSNHGKIAQLTSPSLKTSSATRMLY